MGRITKVTGEFMGVRFEVKPTPIRFDKIIEERRNMLMNWYKENHQNFIRSWITTRFLLMIIRWKTLMQ